MDILVAVQIQITISSWINNFVSKGNIMILVMFFFFAGFFIMLLQNIFYDRMLDKIEYNNFRNCTQIEAIVHKYDVDKENSKTINDARAFVACEMHNWKIFGMTIENMCDYGEAIGMAGIIISVVTGFLVGIGHFADEGKTVKLFLIYFSAAIICFCCMKIWEKIVNVNFKRSCIQDGILNYLLNRQVYVKIVYEDDTDKEKNIEKSTEEKRKKNIEKYKEEKKKQYEEDLLYIKSFEVNGLDDINSEINGSEMAGDQEKKETKESVQEKKEAKESVQESTDIIKVGQERQDASESDKREIDANESDKREIGVNESANRKINEYKIIDEVLNEYL